MNQRDWIPITLFVNTNWQAYSGESTLSCLVQMLGLAVQNFLTAAKCVAMPLAITRELARCFNNFLTTSALILITPTLRETPLLFA